MSAALIPYDQARHALAAAKAVDDVKDILDKAEAMRIYAKRAENRDLEIDAAEIRMFAERRLGQMIAAQKATVGLNRGTRGQLKGTAASGGTEIRPPEDSRPKLADIGISKALSARAQKMAAVPPDKFDAMTKTWRENIVAENERVTTDLLRAGQEEQQRQARRDLSTALSDESFKLTGRRRVGCIYADPAWKRKAGDGDRSYENHYRTMNWDEIIALPIADLLLPDAWGFIWIPRAHMLALHTVMYKIDIGDEIIEAPIKTPLIWAIARAWGFDNYSTCFVWTKTDEEHENDIGTGLVVRDQDEILCLFKKGNGLPKPRSDEKFGSNHRERKRDHSRKPHFYREMIASMTGGVPVLELFARADADNPLPSNWDVWGNEAEAAANETSEAA